MAGVEFRKYSGSSFGEMGCHFDNDLRANENITHSNKTINKELTYKNYYLGASSYQEIVERVNELISEADAINPPKRIRKDRKVSFSLEAPCPPELEGTDQEDIFYQKVFEMYKDKKYLPGLVGGVVNKDEKFEYYDPRKKEMCISRNHIHFLGACLTEDGRINAHDLLTKELCQKVNDDIQDLCLREWGISYQTGEGRQGAKRTVEQLKSESAVKLQEKLAKENLEVVVTMRQEKNTLQEEIEEKKEEARLTGLEADFADYRKVTLTADLETLQADTKAEQDIRDTIRSNITAFSNNYYVNEYNKAINRNDFDTMSTLAQQAFARAELTNQLELENKQIRRLNTKLTTENNEAKIFRDALNAKAKTKEEILKAIEDDSLTNRDISEMIKAYALIKNDNETESIIKTCEALDKIETYNWKSYLQRNKGEDRIDNPNFKGYEEYDKRIRIMLRQSLDYKGRTEIYKGSYTLKNLWADIQADNRTFWNERKAKKKMPIPDEVISLDRVFTAIIPGLIQAAIQAIRSYIEMIRQAQRTEEYER